MTKDETLKMALEALEKSEPNKRKGDDDYCEIGWMEHNKAIKSLRQAIEKAEKKEPKKWVEVECPLCGEMAVAHTHPNLNKEKNT